MDLKNIAANFNSFSRLLDDEIRSRIPESGQIDIEPEDKCVFHDDNDDRPNTESSKPFFIIRRHRLRTDNRGRVLP